MNAAEQATSLEFASKIASAVNLFKQEFPDARADLKPWMNDPDTRELIDPDSIDIGFNFPGRSRLFQSRCILIQIRLHMDVLTNQRRAIGVEAAGFDHQGKQWWFSTVQNWEFEGNNRPAGEVGDRLKQYCREVLHLFNRPQSDMLGENAG